MRVRKTLAAALLLLAAATGPGLALAGAHLQHHDHGHGHGHEADGARELAEILVHGHEHQEGTPEHEHSLLHSPAVRQDAPGSARVPVILETRTGETRSVSAASPAWQLPRIDGPGPPILHLHCTLLI